MYTIGQFSRICQISAKALRHYEKLGLLIPDRVDDYNQYRYYSPEQVDAVKAILFLKDLGIPLKTIKLIVEQGSQPEHIENALQEHRNSLLEQLDTLNQRLVRLSQWKRTMEARKMDELKNYDIRLQSVTETLVYSARKTLTDFHHELPQLIRGLLDELAAKGGVCAGAPIFLYYDNFYDESFDPQRVDVEVAWPVADANQANNKLPAVQAASYTYVGPYDGLEVAYGAMFSWLNENGYKACFPTREISINDPATTPPEQLVTQILIPVVSA
jgi:DNA-binding transcriptional MerR regulator